MLSNDIFYHAITRKTIVAFGSLFSDIKIKRENADKSESQTISVPIAYAPKEKWIVKMEQDPSLDNYTYTTLPRLSFEITNFAYDASRRTNRMNYISCGSDGDTSKMYAPVPYNIDISLYALTKTQEDGLQIIEQILPFFGPDLIMSIKVVPESNVIVDVPVIFNGMSVVDEYEGDFKTRRFVTYTLNFTLKTYMFGPSSSHGVINKIFINNIDTDDSMIDYVNLDMDGDIETGNISFEWIEDQS